MKTQGKISGRIMQWKDIYPHLYVLKKINRLFIANKNVLFKELK